MSDGLCQCGCGNPAPIAARTVTSRGRIKGQPMKFIRGHNSIGMNRSKPYKSVRYAEEDHGYESLCWVWQMKTTSAGYGTLRAGGKEWLAHRWYYTQGKGKIPEGLQLDHLCRVRNCVNPDHLEAVTPMENTRRSLAAKLTDEEARMIEDLVLAGHSARSVARRFGVSHELVNLIRKNGTIGPRRGHASRRSATDLRTA